MGTKESKPALPEPQETINERQYQSQRSVHDVAQADRNHRLRQHTEQRQDFQFEFEYGKDSEFCFLLEVSDPSAYPAEKLHKWITNTELLRSLGVSILGVRYLDRGSTPVAFVYCEDFGVTEFVWDCLNNIELPSGIHLGRTCLPEPSQNETRAVAEKVNEKNYDVRKVFKFNILMSHFNY
jgi:hypothetical protein